MQCNLAGLQNREFHLRNARQTTMTSRRGVCSGGFFVHAPGAAGTQAAPRIFGYFPNEPPPRAFSANVCKMHV
jgi:hypothetical protein